MKKTIHIQGMSCSHCTGRVQKHLSALPGVTEVQVDLKKASAVLMTDSTVSDTTLTAAVDEAGYDVSGIDTD